MEDNTAMEKILSNLKDRHKQMDNLMAFTREMGNVLEINDMESLGAVLSMRQKTMERIDKLHSDMVTSVSELSQEHQQRMKDIFKPNAEPIEFADMIETNIFNTNKMTMTLLKNIVRLDAEINEKLQKRKVEP